MYKATGFGNLKVNHEHKKKPVLFYNVRKGQDYGLRLMRLTGKWKGNLQGSKTAEQEKELAHRPDNRQRKVKTDSHE